MSKAAKRQALKQRNAQRRNRRANVVAREARRDASLPRQHQQSPSPDLLGDDLPAEGIALLNHVDGLSGLRNALKQISTERGEWAGIPMPLEGQPLVIEPRYPHADALMKISRSVGDMPDPPEVESQYAGWEVVNSWRAAHRGGEVVVYRKPNGHADWGLLPEPHHGGMELSTLGAADAWGIEQEARAIRLLGKQLRHRQFKQYLLTGMFVEKSRRSGVHYLFRKLRPTVAMTEHQRYDQKRNDPGMRILCCLCLHPIGHYAESWAGAMCPTDDVLAHLMLCRGDEAMFWRRANQIPAWRPNAGL